MQRNVKGRPNRWTGGLGGFAQRAQPRVGEH
jgi:hypothetical protein